MEKIILALLLIPSVVLAITFGWTAPEVLPGEPPLIGFKLYVKQGVETNIHETTEVEITVDIPDGFTEVWVTALNEYTYTNSVTGVQTNRNESGPSDVLTFVAPFPSKPNPPILLEVTETE